MTQETGTSPEDWSSPSELREWRTCRRRWAWRRVRRIQERESVHTLLGRELHDLAAHYLEDGEEPDPDLRRSWSWTGDPTAFYPGRMLAAAIPLLPAPGTGTVEVPAFLELAPDLWIKVIPDWTAPGRVVDLKTVGSVRNRISRPRLRKDPAAVLYGLENARRTGAPEVELRWIAIEREDPHKVKETLVQMSRAELEDAASYYLDEFRHLMRTRAQAPDVELLEPTRRECPRCSFRAACERVDDLGQPAVLDPGGSLAAIVDEMEEDQVEAPSLSSLLGDIQAASFGNRARVEQGQGRKKEKRPKGWRPPPSSRRWTDLYQTREGVIADSLRVCREHLGEVRRGETVHVISDGTWSMDEPIVHLAELAGPCDLYVATWSVSMLCALRLAEATRLGLLRELRLIIDERIKVNRPEVLDVLTFATGAGNLAIMACHMKAYTLRAVDPSGPAWTMVGSANLNRNPRPEAMVIQEGRDLSDFYVDWIAKQIDSPRAQRYKSRHGPARRKALELMGREEEASGDQEA